jgi:selenocysteine lyase/cysteine desulfurase
MEVREASSLFPATEKLTYLNTAAVGLASSALLDAYRGFIGEWSDGPLDYVRGEEAGERARGSVAALIGADPTDVALIASVSAAAGLVTSQFGSASRGQNVVIGEREYSSNHFPWRLLEHKGYDVRQAAFRNGGIEPDELARHVDRDTVLVAFSAVQTATDSFSSTRHSSSARCRSRTTSTPSTSLPRPTTNSS